MTLYNTQVRGAVVWPCTTRRAGGRTPSVGVGGGEASLTRYDTQLKGLLMTNC